MNVRSKEVLNAIKLTNHKSADLIASMFPNLSFTVKLGKELQLEAKSELAPESVPVLLIKKNSWILKSKDDEVMVLDNDEFKLKFEKVIVRRKKNDSEVKNG